MQEKLLQGIQEMDYPSEVIEKGLEEDGITDRYMAAAYGFGVAKGMIMETVQGHSSGGWIPCSEEMPENEKEVEVTYTRKHHVTGEDLYHTARAFHEDGTLTTEDSDYNWEETDNWEYDEKTDSCFIPEGWFEAVSFAETFAGVDMHVLAWRPLLEPYRPVQKEVGEDYRQRVMDRFCRVE